MAPTNGPAVAGAELPTFRFQAGHIPSWQRSRERYALLPVAVGRCCCCQRCCQAGPEERMSVDASEDATTLAGGSARAVTSVPPRSPSLLHRRSTI